MKKIKLLILAIISVLTFGLFSAGSVSAISDQTYTVTSSNSSLTLCGSGSNYTCSDYSYLILESDIQYVNNSRTYAIQYTVRDGGNVSNIQRNVIYNFPGVLTFDIPSNVEQIQGWAINSLSSGDSFTITLSESPGGGGIIPSGSLSITSNGTYDVTNYASATVDIASDLPPYSQLVVDSFWQYHTAFAGAVVAIIAIFLVYRLIKGRLR